MKDIYKPIEDKLKQVGVKDARNIAKNFLFGQLCLHFLFFFL